jgi:hypothetical protein
MNSLQLISKLKAKSDDLQLALQQVLSPGSNFNNIEKELLKKNCIELYELVLKLKTDSELAEEKTEIKPIFSNLFNENKVESKINQPEEKKIEAPIFEKQIIEIPEPEIAQTIVTFEAPQSFNEVIKKVDVEEETLNSLQEKASSSIQDYDDLPEPELKFNTEQNQQNINPIELNIEKAVENKRIFKTVMPDPEFKPKPSLNDLVKAKDLTYNEKLAQKIESTPLVERTAESPIESMKSEINLNKKIAFVNELFSENVVEYAKAIDKLNTANGLNEALRIFSELKHHYNWQSNNELVLDLERIIKRRHPMN